MTNDANMVDFSGLVLGFSSAALHYLGESAIEGKPPSAANLILAQQNIDILLILRDKTQNNLTTDESKLLTQVIADLQSKFIEKSKN